MSTDLVPVDNMAGLDAMDAPTRELAVTNMLTEARSWLAHAVEATEPQAIVNFKAQMATVAEATKQLGLSREIQLDAQEMVRRAERGVGVAIREGQANGIVARRGQGADVRPPYADRDRSDKGISLTTDFATHGELSANDAGIYHMTDGVSDEQFDEAITEAKAEGNLSRANVVRKVKGESSAMTRLKRVDMIRDLAEQGYSSRQMPGKVGVTEQTIRKLARDFRIDIAADRVVSNTRHIDSNHVAQQTVDTLAGLVPGLGLIDYSELDRGEAAHWATSLSDSFRALNRFRKQIKEMTQ
jgi:hypothetical protein